MTSFMIAFIAVTLLCVSSFVAAVFGHAAAKDKTSEESKELKILVGLWLVCFASGIALLLAA